jgi:FkbM family methyltransferase
MEDFRMKPLPFKMRQETDMEKFRHDSFFEKEPETLAWIESFTEMGMYFDVGANIGVYSLYCGAIHRILLAFAFEPQYENFKTLTENIQENGFKNVAAFPYAVGNTYKKVMFHEFLNQSGASGGQVGSTGYEVTMVKLDNFYMVPPAYVKIDIDGQELAVIQGMTNNLPRIKSILVEVSRFSKQPIMDILTAAGFTTDNRFNKMTPHSRERREKEGIDAENIIFTR